VGTKKINWKKDAFTFMLLAGSGLKESIPDMIEKLSEEK